MAIPKRRTILLVDDNDVDVQLMQMALLQANVKHDLQIVYDGDQALGERRHATCAAIT